MTIDLATDASLNTRATEYATLIAEAAAAVSAQLERIRLPLHILLDAHFGELTENQEELLSEARTAAEAAEEELRQLREIANIDRGALSVRTESIRISEMLASILPTATAQAVRDGIRFSARIDPALPRVTGDRARMQDALRLILADAIRYTVPGSTMTLLVQATPCDVILTLDHGAGQSHGAALLLGRRLIAAQGGQVMCETGRTIVRLARERIA